MMKFSRKTFFDGVKNRIDPTLNQEQVEGFEFLLTSFESEARWHDVRLIAYALATIWHETAYSLQPVEEGYYLGRKAKSFQKKLRYYPFFGRGYIQLTWPANYKKAGKALGIDLEANPHLALEADTAFRILTEGLFRGWFGGKLTTYINDTKTDYVNARRCVNILDKAGVIAGYAKSFEKILKVSEAVGDEDSGAAGSVPAFVDEPAPAADKGLLDANEQPPIVNQQAENIINAGDMTPAAAGVDKEIIAPPKDGSTAASTKMTVAGIVVPTFAVTAIKSIQSLISDGYVSASDIGTTVLTFIRENQKYVFLLIALLIVLLIVKKIAKQTTFLLSMLTYAIPEWNSIQVKPAEDSAASGIFGFLKK